MSVQFGKLNFDGKPVDPTDLDEVRPVLAPYGPDGEGYICRGNFAVLYRAFHTSKESKLEHQPCVLPLGTVITWDGHLDNRDELFHEIRASIAPDSPDVSLVASVIERHGAAGLPKLVGDWAISIWDPDQRALILAKDHIGTRPLYYFVDGACVIWSTILEPLLNLVEDPPRICEEYIAGWLSSFPACHLSPFRNIHSVPPSSFVLLQPGKQTIKKYWNFDPSKKIRYSTDAEYEEHYRAAFTEAVRRKLHSDHPILAELSGGMDSSSIVCVADRLVEQEAVLVPRLDTLSYYDDSEPNWNERPYFGAVEAQRGRVGWHIDVSSDNELFVGPEEFSPLPGTSKRLSQADEQRRDCILTCGSKVVLSGIGGDEVTGGVPTPSPELQDFLVQGELRQMAHQLKVWALSKRKPWIHLFAVALQRFLPVMVADRWAGRQPPAWLETDFVSRNEAALSGYPTRVSVTGPLPSLQESLNTLDVLRRQIACDGLPSDPCYEVRYPYLERGFLEFVFALPRTQLVRPGQRRSLMRRSLAGIVPDQILKRRRKAFVSRAIANAISSQSAQLIAMTATLASASAGIVDAIRFREVLEQARDGKSVPLVSVMRTLTIERWLRSCRLFHERRRGAAIERFVATKSVTQVCGS